MTSDTSLEDVAIDPVDHRAHVIATYTLKRAWPCRYSSRGLSAGGNEILVEELELAHEGIHTLLVTPGFG